MVKKHNGVGFAFVVFVILSPRQLHRKVFQIGNSTFVIDPDVICAKIQVHWFIITPKCFG